MSKNNFEDGISLIESLVSVALVFIVIVLAMNSNSSSIQNAASIERKSDIDYLRRTITDGMDCGQTLRVVPATLTPLTCASHSNVIIRRSDGAELTASGKLGSWSITAGCIGNQIIVKATRPGNDPLTEKPYSSAPAASDLFNGLSSLCRPYFENTVIGDFGGMFQWYVPRNTAPLECRMPNPYTGTCSCPLGYGDFHTSEFNGASLWDTDVTPHRCRYYGNGPNGQFGMSYCGYDGYVCIRR